MTQQLYQKSEVGSQKSEGRRPQEDVTGMVADKEDGDLWQTEQDRLIDRQTDRVTDRQVDGVLL